MDLFPLAEYWWLYAAFIVFVLGLLALDLGVFHRRAHAVSMKEAAIWSGVWFALALVFNYGLYLFARAQFAGDARLLATPGFDANGAAEGVALEFLTGYIVEKALAVDNLFVFVMVFAYFAVPLEYQHRVLFYGIIGALVFRAIFISMGAVLLDYKAIVIVFGIFLMATGVKMLFAKEKPINPEANPVVRLLRRVLPVSTEHHGSRFFIRRNGALVATPLLVALAFVEVTDIVFAVDSVPAIFAITSEPFIVFTSNVFAILGLRSMYFLLAGVVDRFHLLKYGLAMILVFVGLKMVWLNEAFGGKFPIPWSLGIIATLLASSVALSFAFPKKTLAPAAPAVAAAPEVPEIQ